LILICKDSGNARVVKLDVLVGHAHEVHGRVLGDERVQGVGDELGDFALWGRVLVWDYIYTF
jgi:hypothetical protein